MSFEKIPALLEQLVSLVTETNKLLTEQKALLNTPLRQTHVIDASLSTLPTPTISAQTEGRPLTAAEAPAALHGIANVGNAHSPVENQPTQDAPAPAPAPTQSAPEVAPAATVETASAPPSEQVAYTEMDAKNAMLDVANKRGRDAAVGCLTKFNIEKFPKLDPSKYGEFVAYCKSLVQ